MLPSCAEKHKKPVCTKCDAGTRCTKCCLCKPHQRPGRPRKDRSLPDTPVRIHPNVEPIVQFLLLIRHAEKIAPLAETMDHHRRIFLVSSS